MDQRAVLPVLLVVAPGARRPRGRPLPRPFHDVGDAPPRILRVHAPPTETGITVEHLCAGDRRVRDLPSPGQSGVRSKAGPFREPRGREKPVANGLRRRRLAVGQTEPSWSASPPYSASRSSPWSWCSPGAQHGLPGVPADHAGAARGAGLAAGGGRRFPRLPGRRHGRAARGVHPGPRRLHGAEARRGCCLLLWPGRRSRAAAGGAAPRAVRHGPGHQSAHPKTAVLHVSLPPQSVDPALGSAATQSLLLGPAQIRVAVPGNAAIARFLAGRPVWLRVRQAFTATVLGAPAVRMFTDRSAAPAAG